jgi:ring-1,2-phenylacetyl-CoA epoxidase subunit PaaE
MGLPKQKIHFELFTSPTAAAVEAVKDKVAKKSEEVLSDVTIILDGEETHFSISSKGNSILDAALDAGADVPFACKGAVCCTCRAKVIEGSAEMDMNYALEDDEVEAGFILTCQSHPTSSKLVVSFDE